jgi:hypothetical protein
MTLGTPGFGYLLPSGSVAGNSLRLTYGDVLPNDEQRDHGQDDYDDYAYPAGA